LKVLAGLRPFFRLPLAQSAGCRRRSTSNRSGFVGCLFTQAVATGRGRPTSSGSPDDGKHPRRATESRPDDRPPGPSGGPRFAAGTRECDQGGIPGIDLFLPSVEPCAPVDEARRSRRLRLTRTVELRGVPQAVWRLTASHATGATRRCLGSARLPRQTSRSTAHVPRHAELGTGNSRHPHELRLAAMSVPPDNTVARTVRQALRCLAPSPPPPRRQVWTVHRAASARFGGKGLLTSGNVRPESPARRREAKRGGPGETGRRTHMPRSGCWTWRFSRIPRASTKCERCGGSSRSEPPGRVDGRLAPRAPEPRRKASRPGTRLLRIGELACQFVFGFGRSAGLTRYRPWATRRRLVGGVKATRKATGHESEILEQCREAHGSIGRTSAATSMGRNGLALRSKALRSRTRRGRSRQRVLHRTRRLRGAQIGYNGERATTTVTWNGCRRGKRFEGYGAIGEGPGRA
jgi:hypothetical protein